MVDWESYCEDSLWDNQLVWNTHSPRLSKCFQQTVLSWVPPIFLLLAMPVLIGSLIKSRTSFNWNRYNVIRQLLSTGLVLSTFIQLVLVTVAPTKLTADLVNAVVQLLFALLLSILFYLFVRRGMCTSGAIWTYLALETISLILRVVNTFIERSQFNVRTDTTLVINCLITVILFVQSFLSDSPSNHLKGEKKICPKTTASFVSRLSFSWYSSLTYIGWKRPIVMNDVWQTRKEDSTLDNYEIFNRHLEKKKRQCEANGTPLNVNILRLIWSSTAYYFVTGSFFKVFNDIFIFINPMIMKKLMTFTSDKSDQGWHGYIYAVALFLVTAGQIVSLNYYFNRVQIFGMRVRTMLTGAVYRKSLLISSDSRSKFTTGEIVNLMAVDAQRFVEISTFINLIWSAPLQIVVALVLLWFELGISVLGGFFFMIILIPINGWTTSVAKKLQVRQMKLKDERVKAMNEVLSGAKIIKLYGWEQAFIDKVNAIRNKELSILRKFNYFVCLLQALWNLAPFLVSFITFAIYVAIDEKNVLTASKAFVALALFNILRFPLTMLPNLVTSIIMASVSVKRLNKFLSSAELTNYVTRNKDSQYAITLDNCSFTWSKQSENGISNGIDKNEKKNGNKKPKPSPIMLANISIRVKPKSFVAIVGNVGSGKSSLLNAILGNMELSHGSINVDKSSKIAYTPQEAWIQNNTLRDNILFGHTFDQNRYTEVVHACSLLPDFSILPGGDLTEIGEKGINLSGGQKQRVSLARACYNDADIYLLDDPLAAVDSHVGKFIFENILHSETGILRDKTRVMVTNNLSILPHTDSIIVLKDGQVIELGTYDELLSQDNYFSKLIHQYSLTENEKAEGENEEEQLAVKNKESANLNFKINKLVEKEETQTGRVKWSIYMRYMKAITLFWCLVVMINYVMAQVSNASSTVWLSVWSRNATNGSNRGPFFYLVIYGAIGISQGLFQATGWFCLTNGVLGAAKQLHNRMLLTIFRSSMAFFDVTPLGRILNRFSKDIDVCDSIIQGNVRVMMSCLFSTIATVTIITIEIPIFLSIVLPIVLIFYFIQKLYIEAARQLKRLESVSKSPVYSHFSETLSGVSTIRAYSACEQFIEKNDNNIDTNNSCFFASLISNRWLSIRLEMVANLIVLFSALFAVMKREELDPSSVGLIISSAINITQNLNYLVRATSEIETNIVGIERILEYTDLPTEAEWNIEETRPPKQWPQRGNVEFDNYATRYRPGLDLVLKGITISINEGEKVGIVGRTGAGKSSLTLALFRLIESAGGCIKIDGIDISKLGLHQLRQRLTIIPQDPVLFSGTIRTNLDPFNERSDAELWKCLELAHLKSFVVSLDSGLEYEIHEGGSNLSVGQRQLVCLGRALLRRTKILVLDEATAAVDMETDSLIQQTIKQSFSDCTILTIAHRLNTIIDSTNVLVLQDGNIAEYDPPQKLLENPDSIFYSMADAAGLLHNKSKEDE